MKLAIITHVSHRRHEGKYFAYGPYVREMNIWLQSADSVIVVAPIDSLPKSAIDLAYEHDQIRFRQVESFDVKSVAALVKALIRLPSILMTVFRVMKSADHIHLRCPGNMGLIGCIVQIVFPGKKKSAKYAGNWDPNSKQPLSYRLQKWILNNTLLTRNMQVLVYGEWNGTSKNIKPFFTATYAETDKLPIQPRDLSGRIMFLFIGTLSEGKRPLYALKLVEQLVKAGWDAKIDFYGEGKERANLESYINDHNLSGIAKLHGNRNESVIRKAYQQSHFLLLPSKSEGWPKVVAEAMFWGCVPIATRVSCVPYMLDEGRRGLLLSLNLESDARQIASLIEDNDQFKAMSASGVSWSRGFTLDLFSSEIKSVLHQ